MDMDIENELKRFLEGLRSLNNLKDFVDESRCYKDNCCHATNDDDEDEDEDDCEIIESIEEDYKNFMKWAFGYEGSVSISKKKSIKVWKRLHPDIPIPRVLQTEKGLNPNMSTICLFMDGYPFYLAEKNKCNG